MSVADVAEVGGVTFSESEWKKQVQKGINPTNKRIGTKKKGRPTKNKSKLTGRHALMLSNLVPILRSVQSHPRGSGPAADMVSAVNSSGMESTEVTALVNGKGCKRNLFLWKCYLDSCA